MLIGTAGTVHCSAAPLFQQNTFLCQYRLFGGESILYVYITIDAIIAVYYEVH